MAIAETVILAGLALAPSDAGVLKPSDLALSPNVMSEAGQEYNFDTQQRFTGKGVLEARYTYNSLQTYGSNGLPRDAQGDQYD